MPTLAEITSSISDQTSGYFPTDDTRVRTLFIEKLINDKRALLLRQQSDRYLGVDRDWFTVVDCLSVKCDTIVCKGIPSDEKFTYVDLPTIASGRWAVKMLGTLAGAVFDEVGLMSFLLNRGSQLARKQTVFTILDDKAIIRNPPEGIQQLRLIAILQDPQKAADDNIGCINDFRENFYPVPPDIVHQLELLCIKQILSTRTVQPDTVNDAADKTSTGGPSDGRNLQ